MIERIAFLLLAGATIGSAIGVVTARSVFVSALWLIGSFLGVAGLYVLLDAGFLAMIQVLVYVGAISVLILFAVMLTRDIMEERRQANRQVFLGLLAAVVLFGLFAALGYGAPWPLSEGAVAPAAGGPFAPAAAGVVGAGAEGAAAGMVGAGIPAGSAVPGARPPAPGSGDAWTLPGPIAALGLAFMTEHLLAFEVIGAILLVAMVGAIVIARD